MNDRQAAPATPGSNPRPPAGGERRQAPRKVLRFQDLMRHRVQRILLVSNLYDSFTLVEDGRLNEAIGAQYSALNLSQSPDLIRVSTGQEAIALARDDPGFDLVLANSKLADMTVAELVSGLRKDRLDLAVSVLAFNHRTLGEFLAGAGAAGVDRVFLWQGDAGLLLAIAKDLEDRWNVGHDTGEFGVPVILVVEDDVRHYSSLLPVIYTELMAHTSRLIAEGLNLSQRTLRQRARAKVLLCRTQAEAWDDFQRYEPHVVGLISDLEFPREAGAPADRDAGLELVERVRAVRADLPVVLQSSDPRSVELAERIQARFLLKESRAMLNQLRQVLTESFGFGDFVFRMPDGSEVGRASDLRGLLRMLPLVPAESVAFHGEHNHFSYWLKVRTEFALAADLRPRKVSDFGGGDGLRSGLIRILGAYRRQRDRVVVADFDRGQLDTESSLARIGGGSIGGKARGLAFVNRLLNESEVFRRYPAVRITVPRAAVVGSDVFDQFLSHGDLRAVALDSDSDEEIDRRFAAAPFPPEAVADLRALLGVAGYPLAVRSSALLEDSPFHPFSGVYRTVMLPNNDPDLEVRLAQLLAAIKRVYASTFSRSAKAFLRLTPYRLEEERMAVIVQRIAGTRRGQRFYPDIAGVARSYNFYPAGPLAAEDGIVALALGMGRTVVEGETCLHLSPSEPEHTYGTSVDQALKNSQRAFYALDLGRTPDQGGADGVELSQYDLEVAETDGSLAAVGSTYAPDDDRLYDGIEREGIRLVTFAPVLKHGSLPLMGILRDLMQLGTKGTGSHVEIEFAVNLKGPTRELPEFAFLQMRPLALCSGMADVDLGDVGPDDAVCLSDHVLGNGVIGDIFDLVVVDFHRFDRARSHRAAEEVARHNARLAGAHHPYLLIGVGRWGLADPYLGIPVVWGQIAGARVIVEAGFRDFRVEPSQGSHFFQNLTAGNVGYYTVNPELGDGQLDWEWLAAQPGEPAVSHVRHVRLERPLAVRMCGSNGRGAILKPK